MLEETTGSVLGSSSPPSRAVLFLSRRFAQVERTSRAGSGFRGCPREILKRLRQHGTIAPKI